MKINLKTMLKHAQINKYAIASFNFDNLEMLIAITNAAEKLNLSRKVDNKSNLLLNFIK
ncbi:class II fructose-bisphosphate aldolase [Spiroplasma endosymbiont of Aleiodes alternator]|uniref:class II fructose-bisphosphate aldolase n=1 Tax=Spiroplasma endosymbiont of Aleiodes alternator TaxID=3139329 RepID=UPI003CCB6029